jgi:glutamate-1-semialdehyde 2,1-aminomutase
MTTRRSEALFEEAKRYLPGGVNSPVRAFRAVGGTPRFIERAEGARLWDADGREYIDYVGSWGPMILGHAHPDVVRAVQRQAERGTSYGAPTALETELAKLICRAVPSVEMVRFVNSGTEAVMGAIRLARAATKRDAIVKVAGGYHGHADYLLVQAGSGVATLGLPDSPGVPADFAKHTYTVEYNDLEATRDLFAREGRRVAALIVEPVPGNFGVAAPAPGYLEGLREVTREQGALLVFDEVMSGFRVAFGGAQALYGVTPDLTTLGKVIGGGLPVGAYGGRRDLMSMVAPAGPVYQAGTLSGNPLAMAAGLATLRHLEQPGAYERLEATSAALAEGLARAARRAEVRVTTNRVGSMFTTFFCEGPVTSYATAKRADTGRYASFFAAMLEAGIYLAPSQFEAAFVSLAHGPDEVAATVEAAGRALRAP